MSNCNVMPKGTGRLAVLAALPAAVVLILAGSSPVFAEEDTPAYQTDLSQLNDSGSKGTALLSVRGTELTVWIALGAAPARVHRGARLPVPGRQRGHQR